MVGQEASLSAHRRDEARRPLTPGEASVKGVPFRAVWAAEDIFTSPIRVGVRRGRAGFIVDTPREHEREVSGAG